MLRCQDRGRGESGQGQGEKVNQSEATEADKSEGERRGVGRIKEGASREEEGRVSGVKVVRGKGRRVKSP